MQSFIVVWLIFSLMRIRFVAKHAFFEHDISRFTTELHTNEYILTTFQL